MKSLYTYIYIDLVNLLQKFSMIFLHVLLKLQHVFLPKQTTGKRDWNCYILAQLNTLELRIDSPGQEHVRQKRGMLAKKKLKINSGQASNSVYYIDPMSIVCFSFIHIKANLSTLQSTAHKHTDFSQVFYSATFLFFEIIQFCNFLCCFSIH